MEHGTYLNGIKKALRAREITYSDLASLLKMTESGVKKMLNGKDISFRRLLQICDVLNVLPGQLFSLSENASIPTFELSEEQENALLKDRNLLTVYWRFAIEKKDPEEIAGLHSYGLNEVKRLLQKLVSLELVAQRKGRFFPKHAGKFRWPDDSRLAKALNFEWSQLTLMKSLKAKNDGIHRLAALKLSRKSYGELIAGFEKALEEIIHRSEREELMTQKAVVQDFTVLVATSNGVFAK
jgi:DNA-binding Xre family transcriptional regulator